VNSAITDGVSLTLLEAMAASLPVVATEVGGTPEVVDPTTGVLVPARSYAALGAALARVLANRPLRERLGAAGRSRVEREFSFDRMLNTYIDAYTRDVH